MTYRVTLAPSAARQLHKFDHVVRRRIQAAIELLAVERTKRSGRDANPAGSRRWLLACSACKPIGLWDTSARHRSLLPGSAAMA